MKLIKKLISESPLRSVFFRNNTDEKTLINVKLLNVTAISTKLLQRWDKIKELKSANTKKAT